MPLRGRNAPLTDAQRKHYEDLRKNHVPRFLFRAWHYDSGGGPNVSINSLEDIVPAAFVQGTSHNFYEMNESYIHLMALCHYKGQHTPLTEFSSWAASLHFVLCYAEFLQRRGHHCVHVACMDREELDDEVLVWHVPHLLDLNGNHEYLAHGRIRGKGYRAVPLKGLKMMGLTELFPTLEDARTDSLSISASATIRSAAFKGTRVPIEQEHLKWIGQVARLYGPLAFPFATALICIEPRPWTANEKRLWRTPPKEEQLESIVTGWGKPSIEGKPELLSEKWLAQDGMVFTTGWPDLQQWIALLRAFLQFRLRRGEAAKEPGHRTALPSLCGNWKENSPNEKNKLKQIKVEDIG